MSAGAFLTRNLARGTSPPAPASRADACHSGRAPFERILLGAPLGNRARNALGLELHELILAGDEEAREAQTALFLKPLLRFLHASFPCANETLLHDAATDALLDYLREPRRFAPAHGTLDGLLKIAAWRNARDRLRGVARRGLREHPATAEDLKIAAITPSEVAAASGKGPEARAKAQTRAESFGRWLDTLSETDRRVMELRLRGERRVEPYARALEIEALPIDARRRLVNLTKNRLTRGAKRWARSKHLSVQTVD